MRRIEAIEMSCPARIPPSPPQESVDGLRLLFSRGEAARRRWPCCTRGHEWPSSGCGTSRRSYAAPREGLRAVGNQHELLNIDVVVRVRSAVDNVHHRRRQREGPRPPIHDHREDRGRPPPRGLTASETPRTALAPRSPLLGVPSFDERRVDLRLVVGVEPHQFGLFFIDVVDRVQYSLAEIAGTAVASSTASCSCGRP